jgi:hypothetical protein
MTYIPLTQPFSRPLQVLMASWEGSSLSVGGAFTLTVLGGTFSATSTGTSLTLPSGHYFVQAFIDISRPDNSQDNTQYAIYVDGQEVGVKGNSDVYQNNSTDSADAEFTLTAEGSLEIKVTAIENSFPTVTDNSRLIIWRTDTTAEVTL